MRIVYPTTFHESSTTRRSSRLIGVRSLLAGTCFLYSTEYYLSEHFSVQYSTVLSGGPTDTSEEEVRGRRGLRPGLLAVQSAMIRTEYCTILSRRHSR
jgi:hypothetical protein